MNRIGGIASKWTLSACVLAVALSCDAKRGGIVAHDGSTTEIGGNTATGTGGEGGTAATGTGGVGGTAATGTGGMGGTADTGTGGVGGTAATGTGGTGGPTATGGQPGGEIGGATGGMGVGGTGGTSSPDGGGSAPDGGALPSCTVVPETIVVSIVDASSKSLMASLSASVKVVSIEAATTARTIVLESSSQQQWTLYLSIPGMPDDMVKVGDAFDLTVDASEDAWFYPTLKQTVVLHRQGALVLFASRHQMFGFSFPQLSAYGISFADGGATCQDPSSRVASCGLRGHSLRVTVGAESATILRGQTARVGNLSVSAGALEEFVDTGACDAKEVTNVAGFTVGSGP